MYDFGPSGIWYAVIMAEGLALILSFGCSTVNTALKKMEEQEVFMRINRDYAEKLSEKVKGM